MNKYTCKIKTFLDNNMDIIINDYNNNLIDKIKNTYNSVNIKPLQLINKQYQQKLHEKNEPCLIQLLMKNTNKYELKKNNKEYYDLLFNPIKSRKYLHMMAYNNRFISIDNIQHLETENLIMTHYKNDYLELIIYSIDEQNMIELNLKLISKIVLCVKKLMNSNKYVRLILFTGKQKKIMPHNNIFTESNVNTGMTYNHENIFIWRYEEIYKVIIHELLHLFGADNVNNDLFISLNDLFNKCFNINGFDYVSESYIESIAVIIHSVIYSIELNVDINYILSYELLYQKFIAIKILNKSYIKNNKIIINQTTSVASYYLIKYLILKNYDKFINVLLKSNNFVMNNHFVDLFEQIITFDNINNINLDNKILNVIKKNSYIYKTLRMTLFQYDDI